MAMIKDNKIKGENVTGRSQYEKYIYLKCLIKNKQAVKAKRIGKKK